MKLAAIPQPDSRTTTKIFGLIMIQAFIPVIVYRFIFQTDILPSTPAYVFTLMGLAYGVYRINAMPYWQNMLLSVASTFVAVCIGAAGTIYL